MSYFNYFLRAVIPSEVEGYRRNQLSIRQPDGKSRLADFVRCVAALSPFCSARTHTHPVYPSNASNPVISRPTAKVWMSCVPSYVETLSRFMRWRITE